jgi:hypothetical protein
MLGTEKGGPDWCMQSGPSLYRKVLTEIKYQPELDSLLGDAHYRALLRKMNLPEYWDFCALATRKHSRGESP